MPLADRSRSFYFGPEAIKIIGLSPSTHRRPQIACDAAPANHSFRDIFSGLFGFLQTLDFPGAYSASGLISGTPSGSVWLFSFWRITFPLAVIAYVLLKDANEEVPPTAIVAGSSMSFFISYWTKGHLLAASE